MVEQMDKEGFGNCTNTGACEVECPKRYIYRIHCENEQRVSYQLLCSSES